MAQSLSEEEFGRIQEQIIELRTLNYELEGQNQRSQAEIKSLQEKILSQEKEIQKSQKIITKSKNKKEYSLLLEENESFQRQFQAQEENFKLQNQTLLLEITRLNEENDALKKDYEKLHKSGSQESGSNDVEIIRLRAENAALQKSLTNAQEKHEQELNALQTQLQPSKEMEVNSPATTENTSDNIDSFSASNQNTEEDLNSNSASSINERLQSLLDKELNRISEKLKSGQKEQTEGHQVNGESDLENKSNNDEKRTCTDGRDYGHTGQVDEELCNLKHRLIDVLSPMLLSSVENSHGNGSSKPMKELLQQSEVKIASLEKQLREMSGLQLRLDTELEEKHLLQEQLQQKEENSHREISQQRDDIAKMTDKLKKKQESYLQLQEEKEKSYLESKRSMDELKNRKDNEIKVLAEQITKLQEDLGTSNQRYFELQEESSQTIKELQNSIVNHQSKASSNAEETEQFVAQIRQEKDNMAKEMEALNKKLLMNVQETEEAADLISRLEEKLQSSETRYLEINGVVDSLREQSKDQLASIDDLTEQVQQLTEERDKLASSFEETSKLAEKRKSTLDQMAIERQDVDRVHREQTEKINEEHKKTMAELLEQLTGEKKLRKEVDDLQQKLTDMKTKLQASDEKRSWFERTLTSTEEAANADREQNKKIIEDLIEKHNQDMVKLNEEKQNQSEEMASHIEELNSKIEEESENHIKEIEEYDHKIAKLTQELKDKQVENRIAGKKGDQLVKDLKRQYKLERKRADQLQQKLQEALSENRAKQNFDELFDASGSLHRRNSGDSSILSPNRSDIDSPDMRPPSPSQSIKCLLSEDTTDLIERLADVQQEKWLLEEKVRHLEETGGALADDLMQKSHVIQTYAMETKIGPINEAPKASPISSLKEKMKTSLNIGRTKADTKRIQMLLEETLMKNVQLQEDIDRLSKQLEKYIKNENKGAQSGSIASVTMDTNKDSTTQEPRSNSDDLDADMSTQGDQTTLES